jgi:hypothetical protein
MDDVDTLIDDPEPLLVVDVDIEKTLRDVLDADHKSRWERDVQLDLGAKKWRPSAVSHDRKSLLYVCLQGQIPKYVSDRLSLARDQDIDVVVATQISGLYNAQNIEILAAVDADLLVVDDFRNDRRFRKRHALAAIADIEVPLSSEDRRRVAARVLEILETGGSHRKGRRLEALLAFLFSQARDLKVVERNFRTETEEIDLVVQVDNFSDRVWQRPGVPFVLVEAKCWKDKVDQQTVSTLILKLQGKRGSAEIAILVSLLGFTEDAKKQELRLSMTDYCVPMLDRAAVNEILMADDLDATLETYVRRALLR